MEDDGKRETLNLVTTTNHPGISEGLQPRPDAIHGACGLGLWTHLPSLFKDSDCVK